MSSIERDSRGTDSTDKLFSEWNLASDRLPSMLISNIIMRAMLKPPEIWFYKTSFLVGVLIWSGCHTMAYLISVWILK